MTKYDDTVGLILAGGRARRMGGEDKGLIELNGQAMISYIIASLLPQVNEIMINANRNVTRYREFGFSVIQDELSNYQGPLAGMASGLAHCKTDFIVTVPCDGPFLCTDYVERLHTAARKKKSFISVAFDGQRLQPVYALLHKNLLPNLLQFLASGDRKIDRWYEQHAFAKADFSDHSEIFININTPQDLQEASRTLCESK